MSQYERALIWFRRDLRVDDQAALHAALTASRLVQAVFVFDTDILDALPSRCDRRVAFIHASVASLKAELELYGASLQVLHGSARELIPAFALKTGAQAVYCNRDYEPEAIRRDTQVQQTLESHSIAFHTSKDQVVFEQNEVLTQSGKPYGVFTPYKNAWLNKLDCADIQPHASRAQLASLKQEPPAPMPTLGELGFEPTNLQELGVMPGASGARHLFEDFLGRINRYKEARDFPAQKGLSYLSVHLRFGTISIRELAATAHGIGGAGAETWLSELIWREFYQQLLWHQPQLADGHCYKTGYDNLPWPNPDGHLAAWCEARTGYPLVDAAMRQINHSGYMHNRLRMVAASFLTKDLLVDWRLGERYFAEHLIDFDLAANSGGWQWASSVGCDAQPWFRIFNPVTQSERFDPSGKFIRRYLPELKTVPDKFIHAPWQMPESVQRECGVRIGVDYPAPIVDHARQREQALALFKSQAQ